MRKPFHLVLKPCGGKGTGPVEEIIKREEDIIVTTERERER